VADRGTHQSPFGKNLCYVPLIQAKLQGGSSICPALIATLPVVEYVEGQLLEPGQERIGLSQAEPRPGLACYGLEVHLRGPLRGPRGGNLYVRA
jgi:hypothetical protein